MGLPKAIPPFRNSIPKNRVGYSLVLAGSGDIVGNKWLDENAGLANGIFLFFGWAGRFPLQILYHFCKPWDGTVTLNNVPFTREKGFIGDTFISQIGVSSMLCLPTGEFE